MGNLVLAGMVSGGGQALEKGAGVLQQGLIQQSLLDQREKMELERLRLTEGFAAQREQRGYTHAETLAQQARTHAEQLAAQREAGETGRTTQVIAGQKEVAGMREAGDTARTEKQIGSAKEIAGIKEAGDDRRTGMTIAGQKDIHAEENKVKREELKSRERTESEKNRTMQAHYASQDKYWAALADKARAGRATAADYKQAEIYGRFLQERMKGIDEQMKTALPDERDKLQDDLDAMKAEMQHVLGIQQQRQAPSQIVDPFKRPKPVPNIVDTGAAYGEQVPGSGVIQQPGGATGGW